MFKNPSRSRQADTAQEPLLSNIDDDHTPAPHSTTLFSAGDDSDGDELEGSALVTPKTGRNVTFNDNVQVHVAPSLRSTEASREARK
jgi:hypothetical protein